MMPTSHRQEALSLAYIRAIAAQCGTSMEERGKDYGIDLTLREILRINGRYMDSIAIDVQAKSTTQANITDRSVTFDLRIKNYNDLRIRKPPVPRILVLLVLPKSTRSWVNQDEDELILRRCAYWVSLRGRRSIANHRKVRIRISRQNVFSPDALRSMMSRIRKGERL